ncbi:heparin lyase I family protein, partial [Thermodesulfobacteriota bacterium]
YLRRIKMKRLFLILFIILTFAIPSKAEIETDLSWETYPLDVVLQAENLTYDYLHSPYWFSINSTYSVGNLSISDEQARTGVHSLKITAYRPDPCLVDSSCGKRQEIRHFSTVTNTLVRMYHLEEHWVAFSVYLPSATITEDTQAKSGPFMFQLAPEPPAGLSSIVLRLDQDQWNLYLSSDYRLPATPDDGPASSDSKNLGAWAGDTDKWTDWVLHFKLDYTTNGDNGGFVDIYKNGVLIDLGGGHTDTGGNFYNGAHAYPKGGFYKAAWENQAYAGTAFAYTYYMDAIKIGDSSETLESMSPESVEPLAGIESIDPLDVTSEITQPLRAPKNLNIITQPVQ